MAVESLPAPDPAVEPGKLKTAEMTVEDVVKILRSYRNEAEQAREGGLNPRDKTWEQNWDLYWGRYDFSKKAAWQSQIVMPEAAQAIDRWAAAMKEALMQSGAEWYDVEDLGDPAGDMTPHIRKFMDLMLGSCGRTPDGHEMPFAPVFEEIIKAGAMSVCSGSVVWKHDPQRKRGYVAVEAGDARSVWLDPQNRNLYRIRRIVIDKHDLLAMAKEHDSGGKPLYNVEEIARLAAHMSEEARDEREKSTGQGSEGAVTARHPVTLHEFLCTILNEEGDAVAENALCVVANDQFLVRGPEPNPFWHERDWLVSAPLVTVPFSVYGKSYVENWSSVIQAFIEMTNLILDGTYTSTMNAFAACPDMLEDPTEMNEGVHPNKVFQLQSGEDPKNFMREIELGSLPTESITVWQALKSEARDGQLLNEIALGQVPQKGGITATEISATSSNSSAFIKSMAESIEQRLLEQILNLMWWTGLQHTDFADPQIVRALGPDTAQMLAARRDDFRAHPIGFRVRGISMIIQRGQALRQLLAALSVVASNEILMQKFVEKYDIGKLMTRILELHGVQTSELELNERERMIRTLIEQMTQQAEGAEGGAGTGTNSNGNSRGGGTGLPSNLVPPAGGGQ